MHLPGDGEHTATGQNGPKTSFFPTWIAAPYHREQLHPQGCIAAAHSLGCECVGYVERQYLATLCLDDCVVGVRMGQQLGVGNQWLSSAPIRSASLLNLVSTVDVGAAGSCKLGRDGLV